MRAWLVVLFTCWLNSGFATEKPELTVYTYSSFTSEWGPGPAIERDFETVCECDLRFVALDDGVALLSRVRLEGDDSQADVVLGLDINLLAEAAATGLFAPHGLEVGELALPMDWEDKIFLPYDYGYFAFVYDSETLSEAPTSLKDLVENESGPQILIQDPRTSTPGLGLLLWMRKIFGDQAGAAWARLQPRIVTVSKGWSEAYGLFLQGEAPLVLSYTTSPSYHRIAENETRYQAARFAEGHYLQVEIAARMAHSDQPELAQHFLAFMISNGFQQHIPTGNWMFPVIELEQGLPQGFAEPLPAEASLSFTPEEVLAGRKQWIDEWLEALSR